MPAPSVRPTADYLPAVGTVQDPFVVQYGSVQPIDPRSLGIDHPAFVQLHAYRHWVGTDTIMSTLVHFTPEQARELAVRLLQAAATADGINAYDATPLIAEAA